MLVKDFTIEDIAVLKNIDTVEYALSLMSKLKIEHLPVLVEGKYSCLLSEKDLKCAVTSTAVEPTLFAPSIYESGDLLEAVAKMSRYNLNILPVISDDKKYMGVITRSQIFNELAGLCNAETQGSVIVIEVLPKDYALSDIARIVEAYNAHVLCLLSKTDSETGKMTIILKIDLEDSTPVIRSFERFNYNVLYNFSLETENGEQLRDKVDELLYYINM